MGKKLQIFLLCFLLFNALVARPDVHAPGAVEGTPDPRITQAIEALTNNDRILFFQIVDELGRDKKFDDLRSLATQVRPQYKPDAERIDQIVQGLQNPQTPPVIVAAPRVVPPQARPLQQPAGLQISDEKAKELPSYRGTGKSLVTTEAQLSDVDYKNTDFVRSFNEAIQNGDYYLAEQIALRAHNYGNTLTYTREAQLSEAWSASDGQQFWLEKLKLVQARLEVEPFSDAELRELGARGHEISSAHNFNRALQKARNSGRPLDYKEARRQLCLAYVAGNPNSAAPSNLNNEVSPSNAFQRRLLSYYRQLQAEEDRVTARGSTPQGELPPPPQEVEPLLREPAYRKYLGEQIAEGLTASERYARALTDLQDSHLNEEQRQGAALTVLVHEAQNIIDRFKEAGIPEEIIPAYFHFSDDDAGKKALLDFATAIGKTEDEHLKALPPDQQGRVRQFLEAYKKRFGKDLPKEFLPQIGKLTPEHFNFMNLLFSDPNLIPNSENIGDPLHRAFLSTLFPPRKAPGDTGNEPHPSLGDRLTGLFASFKPDMFQSYLENTGPVSVIRDHLRDGRKEEAMTALNAFSKTVEGQYWLMSQNSEFMARHAAALKKEEPEAARKAAEAVFEEFKKSPHFSETLAKVKDQEVFSAFNKAFGERLAHLAKTYRDDREGFQRAFTNLGNDSVLRDLAKKLGIQDPAAAIAEALKTQQAIFKLSLGAPEGPGFSPESVRMWQEAAIQEAQAREALQAASARLARDRQELDAHKTRQEQINNLVHGNFSEISPRQLAALLDEPTTFRYLYDNVPNLVRPIAHHLGFVGNDGNFNQDLHSVAALRLPGFVDKLQEDWEAAPKDKRAEVYERFFRAQGIQVDIVEKLRNGTFFRALTESTAQQQRSYAEAEIERLTPAVQELEQAERAARAVFLAAQKKQEELNPLLVAKAWRDKKAKEIAGELGLDPDKLIRAIDDQREAEQVAQRYLDARFSAGTSNATYDAAVARVFDGGKVRERIIDELSGVRGREGATEWLASQEAQRRAARVEPDRKAEAAFTALAEKGIHWDGQGLHFSANQTHENPGEVFSLIDAATENAGFGKMGTAIQSGLRQMKTLGVQHTQLQGGAIVSLGPSSDKNPDGIVFLDKKEARVVAENASKEMQKVHDAQERRRELLREQEFSWTNPTYQQRLREIDTEISSGLTALTPFGTVEGTVRYGSGNRQTMKVAANEYVLGAWRAQGTAGLDDIAAIRGYREEWNWAIADAVGTAAAVTVVVLTTPVHGGLGFGALAGWSGASTALMMGGSYLGWGLAYDASYYWNQALGNDVAYKYSSRFQGSATAAAMVGGTKLLTVAVNPMMKAALQRMVIFGDLAPSVAEKFVTPLVTATGSTLATKAASGDWDHLARDILKAAMYQWIPGSNVSYARALALNMAQTAGIEVLSATVSGGVTTDRQGGVLHIGLGSGFNFADFVRLVLTEAPSDAAMSGVQIAGARGQRMAAENYLIRANGDPSTVRPSSNAVQDNQVVQGLVANPLLLHNALKENPNLALDPLIVRALGALPGSHLARLAQEIPESAPDARTAVARVQAEREIARAGREPTIIERVFAPAEPTKVDWESAGPESRTRLALAHLDRGVSPEVAAQRMEASGASPSAARGAVDDARRVIQASEQLHQALKTGAPEDLRRFNQGLENPDSRAAYGLAASRVLSPGSGADPSRIAQLAGDPNHVLLGRLASEALPAYSGRALASALQTAQDPETRSTLAEAISYKAIGDSSQPKSLIPRAFAAATDWARERLGLSPRASPTQVPWKDLSPEAQARVADAAYETSRSTKGKTERKMAALGIPLAEVEPARNRSEVRGAINELQGLAETQYRNSTLPQSGLDALDKLRESPVVKADNDMGKGLRDSIAELAQREIRARVKQGASETEVGAIAKRFGQEEFARSAREKFADKRRGEVARAFEVDAGKGKPEEATTAKLQAADFKPEEIEEGRARYSTAQLFQEAILSGKSVEDANALLRSRGISEAEIGRAQDAYLAQIGKGTVPDVTAPPKALPEAEAQIAALRRERIDQGHALKEENIGKLLELITRTAKGENPQIPASLRQEVDDLIRKHINISLLNLRKDGIDGIPSRLREVANEFGLGAHLEAQRKKLGMKGSPPPGDQKPEFKFPERALSLEDLQEKARSLEEKARNQPNGGFEQELKSLRTAIEYLEKNPVAPIYRVAGADESEVIFPNGREGQVDKALIIERPDGRRVEVIVEEKGKGLKRPRLGSKQNPKTDLEIRQELEKSQLAKYTSTGKKTVFALSGEKPQDSLRTLEKVFGSVDNARGLVYLMPRSEYERFLSTGEVSEAFGRFLDSDPKDRRPDALPKLFQEEKLPTTLTHLISDGTRGPLAELFQLRNQPLTAEAEAEFAQVFRDAQEKGWRSTTLKEAMGKLFRKYGLGKTFGETDERVVALTQRLAAHATLKGDAEFKEIIALRDSPKSDPAEIALFLTEFLKKNGVIGRVTVNTDSPPGKKPAFTLHVGRREDQGGLYGSAKSVGEVLSHQFGLDIRDYAKGEAATPRTPAAPLDWVQVTPRKVPGMISDGAGGIKIKAVDIDIDGPGFRMLPKAIRDRLITPDESGFVHITKDLKLAIIDHLKQAVAQRVANIADLPEASRLRQLDLSNLDKNGSDGKKALEQILKDGVAIFVPGHGAPGGENHELYPITIKGEPLFSVKVNADRLLESFAQMPGTKNADVIFYSSCSGGLCRTGENGEEIASNAQRAAQITGKPVIAGLGIVSTGSTGRGNKRNSSLFVWREVVSTTDPSGRVTLQGEGLISPDEAYKIFYPDGTSKPLTFQEVVDKLVDPEKKSRIEYGRAPDRSPLLEKLFSMLPGSASRAPDPSGLREAGPEADGRHLVPPVAGYVDNPKFRGVMGGAIDVAVDQIRNLAATGRPMTGEELTRVMDGIAGARQKSAKDSGDSASDQYGAPVIREAHPRKATIYIHDVIDKNPDDVGGRHSAFYDRAGQIADEMLKVLDPKTSLIAKHLEPGLLGQFLNGLDPKANWGLPAFGESFQRSWIVKSESGSIYVIHPDSQKSRLMIARAMNEWAKALSDTSMTESQFADKIAEVYTVLMHATPYQRGSPAIVESLIDASFRAKFGKSLGMKTTEPFFRAMLADKDQPILSGAKFLSFFSGPSQESQVASARATASDPAAPRPPPATAPTRSVASEGVVGRFVSALKRGLGLSSSSPVNLEKAARLAPEGITPKQAAEIVEAQKKVLQQAHEVPMTSENKFSWWRKKYEPTTRALTEEIRKVTGRSHEESKAIADKWARSLMDRALLGEGATPKPGVDISQVELARLAESSTEAPRIGFIKDAPIYGYRITSARFEDLPEPIRAALGAVDSTGKTYTEEYLRENIGSVIALQMKDGKTPDFYIIGKSTLDAKYTEVPIAEARAKNPKLTSQLASITGLSETLESGSGVVALLKTTPVEMVRLSDLGISTSQKFTIESPWGEQTKLAGEDAFITKNEEGKWYLIRVDKSGLPIAYRSIEPPISPSKTAESADAIHAVWQDYNSYLSRYKPMKNADGSAVTDIDRYIQERGIPPEYRRAYRPTTKGTYEEDIRILPNRYLAPNNSAENTHGAASAQRALSDFSTRGAPATSDEAGKRFESAVERVHEEWWDRNKDWVGPASIPRDLRYADIDTQYNGAIQLYRLAEMQGLLRDPTVRRGVEAYIDRLAERKFDPYQGMSLADAHLAMQHATGTRPAITRDHHVKDFFDGKLKAFDVEMPPNRSNEPQAVLEFIKNHFPDIQGVPSSAIQIRAPPVEPGSTARVYLLTHKETGETLAVMKIQRGAAGLDEIVSTMAVEKAIPTDSQFAPVRTLASGKLKGEDYFFIQEAARGTEADKAFKGTPQDRVQMAEIAAGALATLHGRASPLTPEQAKKLAADLKALQGNGFYDARSLEDFLIGGRKDVLGLGTREGSLTQNQADELQARVRSALDDYSRVLELHPEQIGSALIHGDMHGGNLFIGKDGKATIIDYGGATYFVGKKTNTGDRANDVGRYVGNMLVEATKRGIDLHQETLPLIQKFLSDYKKAVGIAAGSPEESAFDSAVKVYLSRYVTVNLADTDGKKFKPVEGDTTAQLRQRLYSSWLETLRAMDAGFHESPQKSPAGKEAPKASIDTRPLRVAMEAEMHREWADTNQSIRDSEGRITGYKPRYKTTDKPNNPLSLAGGKNVPDDVIADHARLEKLIADGFVIDIASVRDPALLPQGIRKANQDSAQRAFEAVEAGVARGVDFKKVLSDWSLVESGKISLADFLKKYPHISEGSAAIHDAWMKNNSYLGPEHPQMQPFDRLSVSEQKKDVDIVINAHRAVETRPITPEATPAAPKTPISPQHTGGFARGISVEEIQGIADSISTPGLAIRPLPGKSFEQVLINASYRRSFWEKIGVVIRDIAGSHLLNDGNHRVAFLVAQKLIERNGIIRSPSNSDEALYDLISKVGRKAAGYRTPEEIAAKLRGF